MPRRNNRKTPGQLPDTFQVPLKVSFLGGLNEIGKNMTLFEYEGDMVILDCGLSFPEPEMLGVDVASFGDAHATVWFFGVCLVATVLLVLLGPDPEAASGGPDARLRQTEQRRRRDRSHATCISE